MYELATFCRMHKDHLDQRLLLLSPTWPSVFNPFKSAQLTKEELKPLTHFTLAEVQCAMPRDRAIVLEQIRREWGSDRRRPSRHSCARSCQGFLQAPSGATASRWPGWRGVPSRWPLADEWETGTNCAVQWESLLENSLSVQQCQ